VSKYYAVIGINIVKFILILCSHLLLCLSSGLFRYTIYFCNLKFLIKIVFLVSRPMLAGYLLLVRFWRVNLAELVGGMGETRNAYRILARKRLAKCLFDDLW
jgi:hypothetical protein